MYWATADVEFVAGFSVICQEKNTLKLLSVPYSMISVASKNDLKVEHHDPNKLLHRFTKDEDKNLVTLHQPLE